MASKTPKEIRKSAGLSLIEAAVGAKRAENTIRLYEANRLAVGDETRADLDAFYCSLQERLNVSASKGGR